MPELALRSQTAIRRTALLGLFVERALLQRCRRCRCSGVYARARGRLDQLRAAHARATARQGRLAGVLDLDRDGRMREQATGEMRSGDAQAKAWRPRSYAFLIVVKTISCNVLFTL